MLNWFYERIKIIYMEKTNINPQYQAELIADLLTEEKMEEQLISLYSSILESGVSSCLPVDLIDSFYGDLNTLKSESIMHMQTVALMLNKYK